MSRSNIPLGEILGIPIALDYSWFLIFALITWTLAVGYYPAEFPGWASQTYWLLGAVTAVLLFASVVLHELGHSTVARRFGIRVRRITLFIFGGVAQIDAEPPTPRAEFLIAIAGPAVSLALALLFRLLRSPVAAVLPLLALVRYLGYINLALVLFNLIPGFPLDGGRVLRALLWGATGKLTRATVIAATVGRAVALLFILAGVFQIFAGNFINGLWIAFIGWFLESAAVGQVQQQSAQGFLTGHSVSDAMSTNYGVVPAETTIQQLVDEFVLTSGRRVFVVMRGDEAVGLCTLHEVKAVPRAQWPAVRVDEAMIPTERLRSLHPETALAGAVAEMDRDGVNQLPVMTDHHVVGLLSREDVINYLRALRELAA
jgi:Zn-dependent protease/CBS domain-containing protein